MQIMEAKQNLEECISCQDFSRAAVLKDSISQLEELKNQLTLEASQPADSIKEQRVEKVQTLILACVTPLYRVLTATRRSHSEWVSNPGLRHGRRTH